MALARLLVALWWLLGGSFAALVRLRAVWIGIGAVPEQPWGGLGAVLDGLRRCRVGPGTILGRSWGGPGIILGHLRPIFTVRFDRPLGLS